MNIRIFLKDLINTALTVLNISALDKIQIDYAKDRLHGDFSCNIALLLAKQTQRNPRELAQAIILHIPKSSFIKSINSAGAGFINFVFFPTAFQPLLTQILTEKSDYGKAANEMSETSGQRIHLEYVSSNPTGPLHVGHGRGAAYGATLANLLTITGHQVYREYYVNDAGRQMDILAVSIFLRYLQHCGKDIIFPENAYQGEYIKTIAQQLFQKKNTLYCQYNNLINETTDISPETQMDNLIAQCKKNLGDEYYKTIFNIGLEIILKDIKQDLEEFGVVYENFFSERFLWDTNRVQQVINLLQHKNYLYQQDGAVWFRSTEFGDDKDRVIIRENGQYTYFASDIAYHYYKCENYDLVIDVLGADHHGYIPRIKAIIQALGYPVEKLRTPLVQFAVLYRGKERLPMSTRAGEFVSLRELRQEVGNDAARFFYIMRKADQHLDFDLALAKSQSNDNPVYYIQYAHARICSVFRQLAEKKQVFDQQAGLKYSENLDADSEKNLLLMLNKYQETLIQAAAQYEPHLLAYYLKQLCEDFHHYYNAFQFLVTNDKVRHARLCLIAAVRQIIANGLALLGVSAPESM